MVLADRRAAAGARSVQVSNVESQRGANGHATSGRSRRGGAPGIEATPPEPVRSGVAANSMRVYGCRGASCSAPVGPRSAMRPAYITAAVWQVCATIGRSCVIRTIGEPELVGELRAGAAGSAPAPSRRAPSWARRRAGRAARTRAPWRSPRAGACRPRTRAGSAAARSARMPTSSSSSPQRASRRAARRALPCSSIASTIWSPMRCTGLNAFIAPWKTIAMSLQRCGRTAVLAAREDVLAVQQHAAGDAGVGRQQPHEREAERRLAAAGLADEAHALAARERELAALDRVQLAVRARGRTRRAGPATSSTGAALMPRPRAAAPGACGSAVPRGG